jgi:predicted NAD/FAD-binding protein
MHRKLNIGIVGTGIGGLSAAWLLSQRHRVTIFERENWTGGHANTVGVTLDGRKTPVDTGFIVYNEHNYPNLTELFRHFNVETQPGDMSFGVSIDHGRLEYSSNFPRGLLAQPSNLLRPAFWSFLTDIARFYRTAPLDLANGSLTGLTLGQYLDRESYSADFARDHLLPMGAAIWSAKPKDIVRYPAESFVRFFESHRLFNLRNRPRWRIVRGGSRAYVKKLTASFADRIRCEHSIIRIMRDGAIVTLEDVRGGRHEFDHVVIATHANEALELLAEPSAGERDILGAIAYAKNKAFLHQDTCLMPKRKSVWASWNYLSNRATEAQSFPEVSYWLNRLQRLETKDNVFLTLNPATPPRPERHLATFNYDHPIFDSAALGAQPELWSLQGIHNTWFCGSYFGYGFHEDALQAGLAVGEALGGTTRPWSLPDPSSRLQIPESAQDGVLLAAQ